MERTKRQKKCAHPDCAGNAPVFISDQVFWNHMNKVHNYQVGEWCDACLKMVQDMQKHEKGKRHLSKITESNNNNNVYTPSLSTTMEEDEPTSNHDMNDNTENREDDESYNWDSFESFTNEKLALEENRSPGQWYQDLMSETVEESTREIYNLKQIESTPEDHTTESLRLSGWGHRWGIGKGALEDLLKMMTSDDFDHDNIPETVYRLRKDEASAFPPLTLYRKKTDKGDLYFYDYKEYLVRILQIPELQGQFIFDYNYNDGVIEHPSNGELWKKQETFKNHLDEKTNRVHKHCPSQWYVDDFLQQKTRQVSVKGLYWTPLILPSKWILDPAFKILLCIAPVSIDAWDVVNEVMALPTKPMERGVELIPESWYFGSILMILADHPGGAEIMNEKKPSAKSPGRWSHDQYGQLGESEPENWGALRNSKAAKVILLQAQKILRSNKRGQKGQVGHVLKELGLKFMSDTRLSPLWELKCVEEDFYSILGICRLHNIILGNVERFLLYFAAMYGDKWVKEVNMRYRNFKHLYIAKGGRQTVKSLYPTLKHWAPQIDVIIRNADKIYNVNFFSGNQTGDFLQISTWILHGLLPSFQFRFWLLFLSIDQTIMSYRVTHKELDELMNSIIRLKRMASEIFPETSNVACLSWGKITLDYPNYETLNHYPQQIRNLGPGPFMDTSPGEVKHGPLRLMIELTNKNNIQKGITKIESARQLRLFQSFHEESMKHRKDGEIFGKEVSNLTPDQISNLKVFFPSTQFVNTIDSYKGIYLHFRKVFTGDLIEYMLDGIPTISVARLDRIYRTKSNETLILLITYQLESPDTEFNCSTLSKGSKIGVVSGRIQWKSMIPVVKYKKTLYINKYVKHTLTRKED